MELEALHHLALLIREGVDQVVAPCRQIGLEEEEVVTFPNNNTPNNLHTCDKTQGPHSPLKIITVEDPPDQAPVLRLMSDTGFL